MGQEESPDAKVAPASPSRVVHRFDFDERAAGNLEDVPRYWEPLRMAGFPRFAKGGFDMTTGHLAPPSFHLDSQGRSVAYSYVGPETAVRPSSDYRIEAYVRTSGLEHARACLSACFLDESRQPIFESLVRSAWLGESDKADPWVRVELFLSSAPPEAATISLQMWIVQDSMLDPETGPKPIQHSDVHAEAWLDEATIYTSPRVQLTTGVSGNVIRQDDPQELLVSFAEYGDRNVDADLSITDAADNTVFHEHLGSDETHDAEFRISVRNFEPGLYHARLVESGPGGGAQISRTLTFAKLAPPINRDDVHSHLIGIVFDPDRSVPLNAELNLLQRQAVRSVKMPIWHDPEAYREADAARISRVAKELARHGYSLIAMMCGSISPGNADEPSCGENLLQVLRDNPIGWREMISNFAAANASTFRMWQLGSDDTDITVPREAFLNGRESLRQSLSEFIPAPLLGAAISIDIEPGTKTLPIAQPTVRIESNEAAKSLKAALEQQKSLGVERIFAYVAPLSEREFLRLPRLADWTIRLLTTLRSGADTVFVPQTWHRRTTPAQETVIEPTEEFVVLHTIAEILDGTQPGPTLELPDGTHLMAFFSADSSVVALWNPTAPEHGRDSHLQLGHASRSFDLWGRSFPLSHDEKGRQTLSLRPDPVFVVGVDRCIIDLMYAVSICPDRVSITNGMVRQSIEIDYKGTRNLSGRGVIHAPPAVAVSPKEFDFRLMPGRRYSFEFDARYDQNEVGGRKEFLIELHLDQEGYRLELPLLCDIQMPGLEVTGEVFVQNDKLVLRHILRNTTTAEVSFRGMASVPGRERQSKPFMHVFPGETQIVEYRFPDGTPLVGRSVRLGLREMNDGPRMHNIDLVVP